MLGVSRYVQVEAVGWESVINNTHSYTCTNPIDGTIKSEYYEYKVYCIPRVLLRSFFIASDTQRFA